MDEGGTRRCQALLTAARMRKFPDEFADLLTPRGLRVLRGEAEDACALLRAPGSYFVNLRGAVSRERARGCARLLDEHLRPFLSSEERRIDPDSIKRMRKNYSERLNKTIRFKTAFLQRRNSRSYLAAERIGLLRMMRSESFAGFAEAVTGLKLGRDLNTQVICYGHGDYAGPHNDHHPEVESIRRGFVDFHVTLTNDAVAHHYLVYEEGGHLSKLVDVNVQGAISIYKLPFWHYTTPLWGKRGREHEARRWLLLGTFRIVGP